MNKINIKPLSVNDAWEGRRYKTAKYKVYEQQLLLMLPKKIDLPEPPYFIYYEFGFSSNASDYDNPVKPFQDVLQKKYKFNDNKIEDSRQRKFKVKKGEEYIKFKIYNINDPSFLIQEIQEKSNAIFEFSGKYMVTILPNLPFSISSQKLKDLKGLDDFIHGDNKTKFLKSLVFFEENEKKNE